MQENMDNYKMKPLEEMVSTSDRATSLTPLVETKEKARRKRVIKQAKSSRFGFM